MEKLYGELIICIINMFKCRFGNYSGKINTD